MLSAISKPESIYHPQVWRGTSSARFIFAQDTLCINNSETFLLDLVPHQNKKATSTVVHQDGGDKYMTDGGKHQCKEQLQYCNMECADISTTKKTMNRHKLKHFNWYVIGWCEATWRLK